MHDDSCQCLSCHTVSRPLLIRQILQPRGQHLELSARVHSEQRGDSAHSGHDDVNEDAGQQMYQDHDLISRALMRVEENVIITALLHRSDRDILNSTANDRLY